MQEVAALADRIVIIAHGRIVANGTAEEILRETGEASLEEAFVRLSGLAGEGIPATAATASAAQVNA